MISIIIPAYQEGKAIFAHLQKLYEQQAVEECIVIDASDASAVSDIQALIKGQLPVSNLQYVKAEQKGRGAQMNQGAALAKGSILLFLHADTLLPIEALPNIQKGLAAGWQWGRFDVRFDEQTWPFKMIASMMNFRSKQTSIATGDQAVFMSRAAFDVVGGFEQIPLMEDIAISKKLSAIAAPLCLSSPVITSARRWREKGVFKTIVLMWCLRLGYWLGISPKTLANWYR